METYIYIYIYIWYYLAECFLEWEMFQTNVRSGSNTSWVNNLFQCKKLVQKGFIYY